MKLLALLLMLPLVASAETEPAPLVLEPPRTDSKPDAAKTPGPTEPDAAKTPDQAKPDAAKTPRPKVAKAKRAAKTASTKPPRDPEPIVSELRVVAVKRPLELTGKRIKVPKEVYLEAKAGVDLKRLIGQRLSVYRTQPLPVASPAAAPAFEAKVGEVELIAIQGALAIAKVLTAPTSAPSPDLPAVMVGDSARFVLKHRPQRARPKPVVDAPPPTTEEAPPAARGPWEREDMRWRL